MEELEVPTDGRSVFEFSVRVRTYETDALGHVNNAVYLHYMEQAAIEHSEALGWDAKRYADASRQFVIRQHEIVYLGSAAAGDRLTCTTWSEEMSGARGWRGYLIRNQTTGQRLVAARTLWVWLDTQTGRPRPLPRDIVATFTAPQADVAKADAASS
jgi:acyl-CoA thioester hydrolase